MPKKTLAMRYGIDVRSLKKLLREYGVQGSQPGRRR